jgi:ADP-dependent NAD(P)H-hydrate dehydratase / NAD(P)H-hydrate epimerase
MIAAPKEADDKYSRGVLGIITGSEIYPGAAVLGVEAALRTGVGMVRYLGPETPTSLVLQRRPETVTLDGRVQAWILGSGMDSAELEPVSSAWMASAIEQGVPTVLDGGGLDFYENAVGPLVLTPHFGELARLLGADREEIVGDPQLWAELASEKTGATVLLKGHVTYVAGEGLGYTAATAPSWLATAGAGDALGGILGALLATHASEIAVDSSLLPKLAATASVLHGLAATRASGGGPFTVLDLTAAIPATISELLSSRTG